MRSYILSHFSDCTTLTDIYSIFLNLAYLRWLSLCRVILGIRRGGGWELRCGSGRCTARQSVQLQSLVMEAPLPLVSVRTSLRLRLPRASSALIFRISLLLDFPFLSLPLCFCILKCILQGPRLLLAPGRQTPLGPGGDG